VIEKEDVASGLVELVASRGITELVISAAADRHYSRCDLLTLTENSVSCKFRHALCLAFCIYWWNRKFRKQICLFHVYNFPFSVSESWTDLCAVQQQQ
jgi:hypothetical protein